jgi:CDP-diacylglycerol--glycerol-3-phosphate 3-phosphatidyltransferase/cardiolipin synthase
MLTLSRILALPLLIILLWPDMAGQGTSRPFGQPAAFNYLLAFMLYALLAITDYFDGYLARTQGTVSKLGIFLDPIADKIMVAVVILMLVFIRDINGWHVIAALIILVREIIVSGLREFLAGLQVSLPVTRLAKWKTACQLVALGALILAGALRDWPLVADIGLIALWIAALLTLITGWDYLRAGLRHMD